MLQRPAPFFGRPLFRSEAARAPLPPQEFELVASSYRSVYGALLDDARRLYVIDGIALREYSYDVDDTGGLPPLRLPTGCAVSVRSARLSTALPRSTAIVRKKRGRDYKRWC